MYEDLWSLMFLTWAVPAGVPSLFHSSRPPMELDEYSTKEPNAARKSGPPAMSWEPTRTVPGTVPSVFQSWLPEAGSVAPKNTLPATAVSCQGDELLDPAQMSFSITVPAA